MVARSVRRLVIARGPESPGMTIHQQGDRIDKVKRTNLKAKLPERVPTWPILEA